MQIESPTIPMTVIIHFYDSVRVTLYGIYNCQGFWYKYERANMHTHKSRKPYRFKDSVELNDTFLRNLL